MECPDLKSVKDQKVLAYISYLQERLESILKNSRYKTYAAIRSQVDNWNEQISLRPTMVPDPEDPDQMIEVLGGFVDLFADKDSKEFDRVYKFILEAGELEDRMEVMEKKLTPTEKEEATKMIAGSAAEYHIYRKKQGKK